MIDKKSNSEANTISEKQKISRRKVVKTIAGSIGAFAAYHTLPVNWSKPIIEQVFLPAHAQTSGDFVDIHPVVHEHTHDDQDPSTQEVVDPVSGTVLHVHSHPHTHEVGAPDYHADLGTPDPSKDIDHSHTHAHTITHQAQCTQCGEQLLTDGIGGTSNWNSVLVTYNSPDKSYQFRDIASVMTQYAVLAESCVGSTLRLNFGDGGGVGPLTVSVGIGNTVQKTTYTGGGLTFDVTVPAGPTNPVLVDIRNGGLPHDTGTKITSPTLTVIC
jgi:hypothetical protein